MIVDTFLKKFIYYFLAICYIATITYTFYNDTAVAKIASMFIILPAFVLFLVQANFERAKIVVQYPLLVVGGLLLVYILSVVVWIINFEQTVYILAGTQRLLFQAINLFVVLSAVYVFGSKAVDYTFYAACVMNSIKLMQGVMRFGPGQSLSDFIIAIKTGDQVGFMSAMEIHSVSYVFGLFLFYYLYASRYPLKRKLLYSAFCFLFIFTGFKRIIFASIFIGLAAGFFLTKIKNKKMWITIVCIGVAVCSFGYIYIIRAGIFEHIMNVFHIQTNTRIDIYNYVSNIYDFKPTFIGKGFDYIVHYLEYLKTLNLKFVGSSLNYLHNDILVRFIEMGFLGFCGWLYACCIFTPRWIFKHFGAVPALLYCVANLYSFINFSVGNTNHAYDVRLSFFITTLGAICLYQFESKKNKEPEAETLSIATSAEI